MSDVPRETPPVPAEARGVFSSEALARVEAYAAMLADAGVVRGLIGPREVPRLWERHLANSAALAPALGTGSRVADVGTGAGLPGVVLALVRPDLEVTLVEPLLRRIRFLEEVVDSLSIVNARVVRARAEELHGVQVFDVVTSRAVAPLGRLLDWCMPLVAAHGEVLALKGASASREVDEVEPILARRGWGRPELLQVDPSGAHALDDPATPADGADGGDRADGFSTVRVVRVRWADPARVSSPGSSTTARRPRRGSSGSRHRHDRGGRPRG